MERKKKITMQFNFTLYQLNVYCHSYVCSRLAEFLKCDDETMNMNFSQEDIGKSGPLFKSCVMRR